VRIRRSIFCASVLATLGFTPARAQHTLEDAFPNLTFQAAVDIQVPNASIVSRLYVVEKSGLIYVFPELIGVQPGDRTVFLDISSKVEDNGEAGLLGLAFHPSYHVNGYFFVYYVTRSPYRNIVARYKVTANPLVADPASELILIDAGKDNLIHNGGQVAFGAGNLLYITMGDDGNSSNGQDLNDLFGSMLRIAPNVSGTVPAYTIPNSNPFKGNTNGYREEIFAYGFRNPWRFSIDAATGRIWGTDVGENAFEEVDNVKSGGNYGWPLMEGPDCFQPSSCDTADKDLQLPVSYYDHGDGSAVIGGYVYHGTRLPELEGLYIFADLNGRVWSLDDDGVNPPVRDDVITNGPGVLALGLGNFAKRDLYISSTDGSIYRLSRVVTAADRTPNGDSSRLLGNVPNPFNPATSIRYQLAQPGRVTVEIVAVDGSRVRLLEHGARPAGVHAIAWRGETEAGGRAASGVYFYRPLVDGVARDSARMVLVQ